MSDASKAARAAMRSKAKRMADGDPHAKVDASSWTPSEPLNTTTKTGARPVRPRIYKAGGKVQGDRAKPRSDRLPRQIAEAYANRNMPALNADEFGKGHTGAYKKGGRAHKDMGGPNIVPKDRLAFGPVAKGALVGIKRGGKVKKADGGDLESRARNAPKGNDATTSATKGDYKKGGKVGTYFGGTRPTGGRMPKADGGRARYHEGNTEGYSKEQLARMNREFNKHMQGIEPDSDEWHQMAKSHDDKMAQSDFGAVLPMEKKRPARASGGRAKGKTNINILIGGHGQPQTPGAMPGPVRPPVPVPVAPPGGAPQGMPQGMPVPMGGPSMPPQSMGGQMPPPMMRKNGGRIKGMPPKTATSFKDMKAGAGGGLGRLEKAAIARKQYGSPP